MWSIALAACTAEPLVRGVTPVAESSAEAAAPAPYQKPPGVVVDVGVIAGQPWERVRGRVSEQMGDIVEVRALDPRDGDLVRVQRGELRHKDGQVYQVRVDLPQPMRRDTALAAVGLSPVADGWFAFQDEFRLRWAQGWERIRMGRAAPGSELVVWVEARRWDPRTGEGR